MGDLAFRTACDADTPGIRYVLETVLAEFGLSLDPSGVDSDLESVERSYNEAGGSFWVLTERDGRIVGCTGVLRLNDSHCELRKMYLLREWRGKGWGRYLLDQSLAFARESGFRKMSLDTNSALTDAIAMYRRYGFQPAPLPEHGYSRCDAAFEMEI